MLLFRGSSFAPDGCEERTMAIQRITVEELKRRIDAHEPLTILDTRSPEAWKQSDVQIPGSIRVPPDKVADHLSEIARDRLVVAYCT